MGTLAINLAGNYIEFQDAVYLVTEKLKGGSLGVKAASALLVSGMEKGKIYRFDKPVKAYSQEGPLYGCGWNETAIDESKYKVYYFDGKAFQALTTDVAAYRDTHPGEAVLSLYRANVESIDTFRLDIMGIMGDVDGNGLVNGTDVTALYNYLLNGVTPAGNADVDGNGTINGTDVTALYNILLSN